MLILEFITIVLAAIQLLVAMRVIRTPNDTIRRLILVVSELVISLLYVILAKYFVAGMWFIVAAGGAVILILNNRK